jgi:hypothetical protein
MRKWTSLRRGRVHSKPLTQRPLQRRRSAACSSQPPNESLEGSQRIIRREHHGMVPCLCRSLVQRGVVFPQHMENVYNFSSGALRVNRRECAVVSTCGETPGSNT